MYNFRFEAMVRILHSKTNGLPKGLEGYSRMT